MRKLFFLALSAGFCQLAQGQNELQPPPPAVQKEVYPPLQNVTHQLLPADDAVLETCIIAKCKNITLTITDEATKSVSLADPAQLDGGSQWICGTNPGLTFTPSTYTFTCANLGVNTVGVAVSNGSHIATCVSDVTVVSGFKAKCKDVTLTLDNGAVTLNPAQLDNGSGFICGNTSSLSFTASKTNFTCANLGTNSVTLTATSGSSNGTCNATVTVVGITDLGALGNFRLPLINNPAVVAKLAPWTAYKGWTWNAGQQHGESFQLLTTFFAGLGVIQGTAPYTCKWTLNGQSVGNNSPTYNGSAANMQAGRYDYRVDVTDANGCKGAAPFPVNIVDVRCKIKKTKDDGVQMCFAEVKNKKTKYSEECVYPDQVETNLLNQFATWTLGACPANNNGNKNAADELQPEALTTAAKEINKEADDVALLGNPSLKAFPNPSRNGFTLDVVPPDTKHRFLLKVMDNTGRTVEEKVLGAPQRIQIGASYKPGLYYVELQQGTQKATLKLIKQ